MTDLSVLSIKKSIIPSRVIIRFSDGNFIPLLIDDVVKLSVKKGEILDNDRFNRLVATSYNYLVKDYALRQIALAPKTKKLLQQKISQKNILLSKKYPLLKETIKISPTIDEVLTHLENSGLLNELDYARYVINRHHSKSTQYIRYFLLQKGVNLNNLPPDLFSQIDSTHNIKKHLLKKFSKPQDLADFNTKNKFIASMLRKGFSHSEVKTVIDDFLKSK